MASSHSVVAHGCTRLALRVFVVLAYLEGSLPQYAECREFQDQHLRGRFLQSEAPSSQAVSGPAGAGASAGGPWDDGPLGEPTTGPAQGKPATSTSATAFGPGAGILQKSSPARQGNTTSTPTFTPHQEDSQSKGVSDHLAPTQATLALLGKSAEGRGAVKTDGDGAAAQNVTSVGQEENARSENTQDRLVRVNTKTKQSDSERISLPQDSDLSSKSWQAAQADMKQDAGKRTQTRAPAPTRSQGYQEGEGKKDPVRLDPAYNQGARAPWGSPVTQGQVKEMAQAGPLPKGKEVQQKAAGGQEGDAKAAALEREGLGPTVEEGAVSTLKSQLPKFIYVYDVPPDFTVKLLKHRPRWWSEAYESEEFLYHLLAHHGVGRTADPEHASLFYVPLFLSRFLMLKLTEGLWTEHAIRAASKVFEDLLALLRKAGPWLDRNRGRDHFTVLAADHGRCSLVPFVRNASSYGDMFFLQHNGDKLVRSNNIDERKQMHTLSFNPSRNRADHIPEFPCYDPGRDILLPAFVRPSFRILAPSAANRSITALFRFGKYYAKEEAQAIFFNHPVRFELYNLYATLQLPKWEFGTRSREQMLADHRRAIFCVCPPGHSQWTMRPSIAILSGCIPVTFFREHNLAFQSFLDYSTFSLNVDPDDVPLLKRRVDRILRTAGSLQQMQAALTAVQSPFSWDPSLADGAVPHIFQLLLDKACNVSTVKAGLDCDKRR